jgi:hypothetical protein
MWDESLMFYKMVGVLFSSVPFHLEKKKGGRGKKKEKQRKIKCKRIRRVVPNIHSSIPPFSILLLLLLLHYSSKMCQKKSM